MTTEKEAKMLKCPTTRIPANAFAGEPCIGSACMRWRWESQQEHRTGEDRRGYCGSGGKP
jgi:hypothetical protein